MTTTTKELNGINYELYDDGSKKWAVVTSARPRRNSAEEFEIPHDVDGYVVTEVGKEAFGDSENQWIKMITFNSPIEHIHIGAFRNLLGLALVIFMDEQDTPIFDTGCFEDCDNLRGISWVNHKRFGEIALCRYNLRVFSENGKRILRSVLMKSNKKAFAGCFKMPPALEKH